MSRPNPTEEIPSKEGGRLSSSGVGAGVCSVFLGHHPSILTKEKKKKDDDEREQRYDEISGEDFISISGGEMKSLS